VAVIESAPPDKTNVMLAQFFANTQKNLMHFQSEGEAKAKRLGDES
jgi:hypothetical protein